LNYVVVTAKKAWDIYQGMNLNDEQRKTVAEWLEQGLKLSDIQKRLGSELGVNLTYMEVRFLLDDLRLKPKELEPPPAPTPDLGKKVPDHPAAATAPGAEAGLVPEEEMDDPGPEDPALPEGPSNVSVSVDRLARPGALVSGNVTFSDGKAAQWYSDQTGRLGIVAKEQGYRPSQTDLMAFQTQLQSELAKLGF
jgi:hypothetical protein